MRTPLPQQSSSSTREDEIQRSSVEDKRKWRVASKDAAKRMLKYSENSEDLKVGLCELKEQLETPQEAGISIMQIAKQARNERGQKLFQIFRQEEKEVYIASLARWDTQLIELVELERRCQELIQEVELLIERQEVLAGLVEDKSRLQSKATEKYCETIFEEMREGVGREEVERSLGTRTEKAHVKVKGKERECC